MNHETITIETENTTVDLPADNKDFDMRKFMGPQELAFMDVMLMGINTYMSKNLDAHMAPIVAEIAARVDALAEKLGTATPISLNFKEKIDRRATLQVGDPASCDVDQATSPDRGSGWYRQDACRISGIGGIPASVLLHLGWRADQQD